MSYIYYNPNPLKLSVGDCTIRAISCALNLSWDQTYYELTDLGFKMYDMPSANRVWGQFLKNNGFKKYQLPDICPDCYTIKDFCLDHPYGTFIVGTGEHEIVSELQELMNETQDAKVREAIQKTINEMSK